MKLEQVETLIGAVRLRVGMGDTASIPQLAHSLFKQASPHAQGRAPG